MVKNVRMSRANRAMPIEHGPQATACYGGAKKIEPEPVVPMKTRAFGSTDGMYPETGVPPASEEGVGREGVTTRKRPQRQ